MTHVTTGYINAKVNQKYHSANMGLCFWPIDDELELRHYKRKKEEKMAVMDDWQNVRWDSSDNHGTITGTATIGKKEEKMGFFKKIKWMYQHVNELIGVSESLINDVKKLDDKIGRDEVNAFGRILMIRGGEYKTKNIYQRISELEQTQSPDNKALSDKIDAIARHLEMEFEHKSQIELNEYELVEPTEDDEDDYDY
jgi:hypothetical protein